MISDHLICCGKGVYIFWMLLRKRRLLKVGRLGEIRFQAGHYAYVGSAQGPGGLSARLKHHFRISSEPHWHVDYLRKYAHPDKAWVIHGGGGNSECALAKILQCMNQSRIPAPGFGASDCDCPTHLFYFARQPGFDEFQQQAFRQNVRMEMAEAGLHFQGALICIDKKLRTVTL